MTTANTFVKFQAQIKNPQHRDGAFPFDQLQISDFMPAIELGFAEAVNNLEQLANDPAPPTFANTMIPLEDISPLFDTTAGIYFNLFSAEASPELQALAGAISAKGAELSSLVSLNEKLFLRIKTLFESRASLNLDPESLRLLEESYKSFARNGVQLPPEQKEKLKKIDQELSVLSPKFAENVLKATNKFELWLTEKSELQGLPEGVIETAKAEAEKKGRPEAWLFTLHQPSFQPFMEYSHNRELRKRLWQASASRAFGDEFDNQEQVLKIAELRRQRAQLLGYQTHAEFVLEERMAEKPAVVQKFLNDLLIPAKRAAQRDLTELKAFKRAIDGNDEVMPWDFMYLSEKLKLKKYSFSEEELRPYFKLENVVEGVFEHARRLFNLSFNEVHDVPKYHEDVRTFEVREQITNKYIGLFYTDFFPRPTKKGGAWMTAFRDQGTSRGELLRPHVIIVCNFTKPTPSKPSLLTHDEVLTLFHEFGHALHGLLSQCTYKSLSGTRVYWDFVELPSQIMENWAKEKEGLDVFARHYQSREPLPEELVNKLKRAQQFQSGYYALRQLNFASLDMAWFTQTHEIKDSVKDFELQATHETRLLPYIEGSLSSTSFSHIFSGGYSAGYYSYKWAEVLDADAFESFKEEGLFNAVTGERFKNNILSRGGTEHPMKLYKKFKGREPNPAALMKREGLTPQ